MSNLLANGMAMLASVRAANMSETVTYHRGGTSVELAATVGATEYEVADDNGFTVTSRTQDFIVTASTLVLGGIAVLPEIGDRIRMTSAVPGRVEVYEVMDMGDGPYRQTGPSLRVHVRHVGQEG